MAHTRRLSFLPSRLDRATRGRGAGRRRTAPRLARWVWAGALLGGLAALVWQAPARWLAQGLASASQGRVLLADAQGSIWNGSAVVVLTGGTGASEARLLPGRLAWQLTPHARGLDLRLAQACCLEGQPTLHLLPGLGRLRVEVQQQGAWLGSWPAALLTGLGTPWNTIEPGGSLRLRTQGAALSWVAGRFAFEGQAELEWREVSSRVSTLPRLGSYRFTVASEAQQAGTARLQLSTLEGPLQLSAQGSWGSAGLRLRGEAQAAEADEPALSNLLNIIGRRDGARSLISIG
jgi:general secretion pathway protein N